MRWILLIGIIFGTMSSSAQDSLLVEEDEVILEAPMENFEFKLTMQLGLDYPILLRADNAPYGLDVAARSNTIGWWGSLSMGFEIKRRMGLEISAGFSGFGYRKKYFEREFNALYPDFDVETDEELIYSTSSKGSNFSHINPKIYWILNPAAKNKIIPIAGVLYTAPTFAEYQFVLRDPGTNYFTQFELTQLDGKGAFLFNGGFEIRRTFAATGENGRISNLHAALRTMITFGTYTANYEVRSSAYPAYDTIEEFKVDYRMVMINVGVVLNMFSY